MNAIFLMNTCHFCHIYRPHPHGNTMVSVPITMVLPLTLSPFPRYYRNFRPHPHGITVVSVPITMVLPLTLSPFPWYYRNFRPHYHGFTADLPLSPSPCSCLVHIYTSTHVLSLKLVICSISQFRNRVPGCNYPGT